MVGNVAYNVSFKSVIMNRRINAMLDITQPARVRQTAEVKHLEAIVFDGLKFSIGGYMYSQISTLRLIGIGFIVSASLKPQVAVMKVGKMNCRLDLIV